MLTNLSLWWMFWVNFTFWVAFFAFKVRKETHWFPTLATFTGVLALTSVLIGFMMVRSVQHSYVIRMTGHVSGVTSVDDDTLEALSKRIKEDPVLLEYDRMKFKLVLFLAGSVGGILWASYHTGLRMPAVADVTMKTRDGIEEDIKHVTDVDLGWTGDALFGAAGAFVVFLVTPNLSEGLTTSELDIIEVMAVATVGGYSARSIMDSEKKRYDDEKKKPS